MLIALEVQNLNHWTTWEVPLSFQMTVLSGATLLETTSCTAQSPSLPPLTGIYQGQPTLPLSQLHSNTQIDPSKDIDPGLIR